MNEIQQRELNKDLFIAVRNRDIERVKSLLKKGANVNALDRFSITPLHYATESGYLKIVDLLIKNGANVNALDRNSSTPLHCAVESDCLGIVDLLLKNGADINVEDYNKSTPLTLAISMSDLDMGNINTIELIVNHTVKLEAADLYVSEVNLQEKNNFINSLEERNANNLQRFQNCQREIEKLKKGNRQLYNFLKESDVNVLITMREKNENVRGMLDDQKSLKEQYPEYADILTGKVSEVNRIIREIFLQNHKPLIDALSTYYECEIKNMTLPGIKNFFKTHRNDFREELGSGGIALSNFIDFEGIAERHTPTLGVQAFTKFVKEDVSSKNLNNPSAEQLQGASLAC